LRGEKTMRRRVHITRCRECVPEEEWGEISQSTYQEHLQELWLQGERREGDRQCYHRVHLDGVRSHFFGEEDQREMGEELERIQEDHVTFVHRRIQVQRSARAFRIRCWQHIGVIAHVRRLTDDDRCVHICMCVCMSATHTPTKER
jgi:hypothetical protein